MLRDIIYADDLCTHGTRPYEGAEAYIKLSAAVNIIAAWMIQNGFATGHGETIEGLLVELKNQIDSIRLHRDNYKGMMEVLQNKYIGMAKKKPLRAFVEVQRKGTSVELEEYLSSPEWKKVSFDRDEFTDTYEFVENLCIVCRQLPPVDAYGDFCSRKCRAEHYD